MKKATAAVTNSFISVFPEHKGITRILLIPIGDQTLDSFEFGRRNQTGTCGIFFDPDDLNPTSLTLPLTCQRLVEPYHLSF